MQRAFHRHNYARVFGEINIQPISAEELNSSQVDHAKGFLRHTPAIAENEFRIIQPGLLRPPNGGPDVRHIGDASRLRAR